MKTTRTSGSSKPKKLMSILIEVKANGFEITKQYEPETGKDGFLRYEGQRVKDSMVFDSPGDALSYLEECMGKKEHAAHEKAEMKGSKSYSSKIVA